MIAAVSGDYQNSEHFSASEKAAMKWAEVMTEKQYQGSPGKSPEHREALEQLKKYYNNEQIVEIAFTSGFFNFWNRFTDSFEIDIEDNPVMALFKKSTTINPDDYVAYMRDCWWNLKQVKIEFIRVTFGDEMKTIWNEILEVENGKLALRFAFEI